MTDVQARAACAVWRVHFLFRFVLSGSAAHFMVCKTREPKEKVKLRETT